VAFPDKRPTFPLPEDQIPKIVPTPRSAVFGDGTITLDASFEIHYQNGLQSEASLLSEALEQVLASPLETGESIEQGANIISLSLVESAEAESYTLSIQPSAGIEIQGADAAGVLYGIQSLRALVPIDAYAHAEESLPLAEVVVKDAPRFPYRGLHLDVARNFQGKEAVKKLLDLMAFYKLNKLHMHLADDEGWRLEIEGLPELTRVGAFRGHTLTDEEFLHPAYGSGPFPDPERSHGSGHYSISDFQ